MTAPDTSLGRVLIIGGTGMLAEASRWIAARSEAVTLVARRPEALAAEIGATPVTLDWSDSEAASRIAALPGSYDLAVIWLHDNACHLARPAEDLLEPHGRSIRVHGSLSADPQKRAARDPNPRPGIHRQVVILGWHHEPGGGKRWLSDGEISAGTIAAIREPRFEALTIGGASG